MTIKEKIISPNKGEKITAEMLVKKFETHLSLFDRESAERTAFIYLDYMTETEINKARKDLKQMFNFII